MHNLVDLSNKSIVVIGASQGIGRGIAILLSKLGAKMILVARNKNGLQETLSMLEGCNHVIETLDVSDLSSVEAQIKNIVAQNGAVDGLVYCAGVSHSRPLQFYKPELVSSMLTVNLQGFIECVRCFTKKKMFNPGMRIVGISSIAAFQGDKTHTIYSASKAGMNGAVRCMAKELADKGICINTVAPAFIRTSMYEAFLKANGEDSDSHRHILERQYLGIGEVEDVANAVAFLLSSASRFITGVCLPVDGGATSN